MRAADGSTVDYLVMAEVLMSRGTCRWEEAQIGELLCRVIPT